MIKSLQNTRNKDAYEKTAEEFPIITTKPFFQFGRSLHKIKQLILGETNGKDIR